MKRVRDIVPELFQSDGGAVTEVSDWLPSLWSAVAGDALAGSSRAIHFRNGTLTVETPSPQWAEQLRSFEPTLRNRLNQRAGRALVTRIAFRAGGAAPRRQPARAQTVDGVSDPVRRAAYERSKR